MPLVITMRPGDKIIVNGAVIENTGTQSRLTLHNQAVLLRGKEVMQEDDVCTPASRVYYALQCAYVFPEKQAEYLAAFQALINDYEEACPSAAPITTAAKAFVADGHLYKALRASQSLLSHEYELSQALNTQLRRRLTDDGDLGETAPTDQQPSSSP